MGDALKAPFPWFGGKSRAVALIWPRFGDVANYVEPFFGSGAVLLARPHTPRIETVNDYDGFVANFWRSIRVDPVETARWADAPVNEADLHAVHRWLVNRVEFRERIRTDPDYHDAQIAGRWVWGLCAWIGSGWCSAEPGVATVTQMDHLSDRGMGVHRPGLAEHVEPSSQLPHLGNAGRGGHRAPRGGPSDQLPHLGGTGMDYGRGVYASSVVGLSEQLPRLGGNGPPSPNHGAGIHGNVARTRILATFEQLSRRLRGVRVACGDFERVLSDSVTWRHGTTAILLDPPYAAGEEVYSAGDDACGTFARAAAWATEHGADKRLRIALCGYEGTWTPPDGWTETQWKARGGYGSQRADGSNDNAKRERIWFSPGCLRDEKRGSLFDMFEGKDQR